MINILETYEPPPLSDNVRDTLRSIVEEAEKELVP
jgi:trimethylamine:corrinoid methyltransferase-like protein